MKKISILFAVIMVCPSFLYSAENANSIKQDEYDRGLHQSVMFQFLEGVQKSLDQGANPQSTINGNNPLHILMYSILGFFQRSAVVRIPYLTAGQQETASKEMLMGIQRQSMPMLELLIRAGTPMDVKNTRHDKTPIELADTLGLSIISERLKALPSAAR